MTETLTPVMAISSPNIALRQLEFKVNKRLDRVRVNVTVLNASGEYPRITGEVYQYLRLTTENLDDQDLAYPAELKFRVDKKWLEAEKVNSSDIQLFRHKGSWVRLNTSIAGETNTTVNYVAYTPGFSVFAIAASKGGAEINQAPRKEKMPVTNETTPKAEELPAITEIEGGKVKGSEQGFFVITGSVIADAFAKRPGTMNLLTIVLLLAAGIMAYTHANGLRKWPTHFKHPKKIGFWIALGLIAMLLLLIVHFLLLTFAGK